MLGNDMSVADVMAIARTTNGSDANDAFGANGGGGAMWVILLFFLLAMGGGSGFGFNNKGANGVAFDPCCAPATQQGMASAFNFNQLDNGIRGLERGLCDLGFTTQGMVNTLGSQISDVKYAVQDCCCSTQRSVDSVKYEMAKGFCETINNNNMNTRDIIENNNSNTQRIMDTLTNNTIQDLRDKLNGANAVLAQDSQSRYLLSKLGRYEINPPCPIGANNVYGYHGFNGFNGFNPFNNCCN